MATAGVSKKGERIDLDKVGATASITCAIHCAVMPLLITLLPLVGFGFLSSEPMEWGLVGVSVSVGLTSLCFGYRKHGHSRALEVLGPGLAFVVLGRIAEEHALEKVGVPLVVLGGFMIAASHLVNRRLCRACRACNSLHNSELDA